MMAFQTLKTLNRDMECIKKIQIESLEVKTTLCEMKNTLVGINSIIDTAKGKIGEFDNIAIKTIQGEVQR